MSMALSGRIGNDYFAYAQAGGGSGLGNLDLNLNINYNQYNNNNCFNFDTLFGGLDCAINTDYYTGMDICRRPVAANETGKIWGDPHFVGGDGDIFDVQGVPGKTYNLLSDKNLSYNGKFESWGGGGATVVGESAINVGSEYSGAHSVISFNKSGVAKVNGQELKDGQTVQLADGGTATKKGNVLTVTTAEGYTIIQTAMAGGYINSEVKTSSRGVNADGVMPGGLLGQTFDADSIAKRGKTGAGAQGEGAIAGKVSDYETNLYALGKEQLDQYGNSNQDNRLALAIRILQAFSQSANDQQYLKGFSQVLCIVAKILGA